jgi:hypothetical protein
MMSTTDWAAMAEAGLYTVPMAARRREARESAILGRRLRSQRCHPYSDSTAAAGLRT